MARNDKDDLTLFRKAMADVRRLPEPPAVIPEKPRPLPIPHQRHADEAAVLRDLLTHEPDSLDTETGEELLFARPGVQRRVLRRLRRGQYGVQAEVDLHGMTVPVAHQQLREFLAECRLRKVRCVRVIHGKGNRSSNRGPILKGKVDRWLRQWDEIIAFASARPVDGGTGAVYVLLRA